MVPIGRANYRTLFENLVLTARRIATLQEAVVLIERYFNERLHRPRLIHPAENRNWESNTCGVLLFSPNLPRLFIIPQPNRIPQAFNSGNNVDLWVLVVSDTELTVSLTSNFASGTPFPIFGHT
jgi:hypothetical protein